MIAANRCSHVLLILLLSTTVAEWSNRNFRNISADALASISSPLMKKLEKCDRMTDEPLETVHVLERYGSFATMYHVGEWDESLLEDNKWHLVLSFKVLPIIPFQQNCYEILDSNDDDADSSVSGGHFWRPVPQNESIPSHSFKFCLPVASTDATANDENRTQGFLYYAESLDKTNTSMVQSDIAVLNNGMQPLEGRGFHFRPCSYMQWQSVNYAMTLVQHISVVVGISDLVRSCRNGVVEGSDYNANYDENRTLGLCVQYAEGSPRDLLVTSGRSSAGTLERQPQYITEIRVIELPWSQQATAQCHGEFTAVTSHFGGNHDKPYKLSAKSDSFYIICFTTSGLFEDSRTGGWKPVPSERFLKKIAFTNDTDRAKRIAYEHNTAGMWPSSSSTGTGAVSEEAVNDY